MFATDYDLRERSDGAPTSVAMSAGDIVRFVQGARLGRVFDAGSAGLFEPAARFGVEEQTSAGGSVRLSGENKSTRPTTDGIRGFAGFGVTWQLNRASTDTFSHSVHLDYEATFGQKYDRPWSITAGYRARF